MGLDTGSGVAVSDRERRVRPGACQPKKANVESRRGRVFSLCYSDQNPKLVMTEPSGKLSVLGRLVYGTSLRRTLFRALIVSALCLIAVKFVFIPVRVEGGSMSPTYSDRGLNLVNRMAYKRHAPRRGDVVAIWLRENGYSVVLMKRIVGLPGESIGFKGGYVTVNGVRIEEPYVRFGSDWNHEPVLCGPDEYFYVGDNRSMPMEDHTLGLVKRSMIAGKMVL